MRATLRWAHADLRTHRGEALFLVLATAGIVASLLLAAALFGYATNPWQRVFTQSQGAHVWIHTGPSADARELAERGRRQSVAGPYPTAAGHRRVARHPRLRRAARHRRPARDRPSAAHLRPLARPRRARTAWCWRAASPGRCWAEPGDTLTVPGTAPDADRPGRRRQRRAPLPPRGAAGPRVGPPLRRTAHRRARRPGDRPAADRPRRHGLRRPACRHPARRRSGHRRLALAAGTVARPRAATGCWARFSACSASARWSPPRSPCTGRSAPVSAAICGTSRS